MTSVLHNVQKPDLVCTQRAILLYALAEDLWSESQNHKQDDLHTKSVQKLSERDILCSLDQLLVFFVSKGLLDVLILDCHGKDSLQQILLLLAKLLEPCVSLLEVEEELPSSFFFLSFYFEFLQESLIFVLLILNSKRELLDESLLVRLSITGLS